MDFSQGGMGKLVAELSTKSDKIRKLAATGYSRSDIAKFLGIRYQHVRNVLVDDERRRGTTGASEAARAWVPEPSAGAPGKIRVRTDGSAVVPASVLEAAGLHEGDALVAHVSGEGAIQLLSGRAAIRYAQALVRQFVPENVSLVDELIRARRREAGNE